MSPIEKLIEWWNKPSAKLVAKEMKQAINLCANAHLMGFPYVIVWVDNKVIGTVREYFVNRGYTINYSMVDSTHTRLLVEFKNETASP